MSNKKEYMQNYMKNKRSNLQYRIKERDEDRKRLLELKKRIFLLLGNGSIKCSECGFSDIRALQIDHVKGNGSINRKKYKTGFSYYYRILKEIRDGSKDYQLLCANCNWIKRSVKHEYVTVAGV